MKEKVGDSGDIQGKNMDSWIKLVQIFPSIKSNLNADGEGALNVEQVEGSCHKERGELRKSQLHILSKFTGNCVLGLVDNDGWKVSQDQQGSDPISSVGPGCPNK